MEDFPLIFVVKGANLTLVNSRGKYKQRKKYISHKLDRLFSGLNSFPDIAPAKWAAVFLERIRCLVRQYHRLVKAKREMRLNGEKN